MRPGWKQARMAVRVCLMTAVAFYAGFLFGAIRDRVIYEFPAEGLKSVNHLPQAAVPSEREAVFTPVVLEHGGRAQRRSLERKIFGNRRGPLPPAARNLEPDIFAADFTGAAAFESYYRQIFADRRIRVSEISGSFDEIEGYRWTSILLRQGSGPVKGLFLYHHGHDGNPFAFAPPNIVIRAMLERGYDVAVLCMPGLGWNGIGNARIKTWDGWVRLSEGRNERHALFTMIDTDDGHFIKFFLAPVIVTIDQAINQRTYRSVVMVGHSGGGWATTLAAALDERIDLSISYAGTLPFFARRSPRDLGDAEQMDPGFYSQFPYTLLYELASASPRKRRVHYQVFDMDDGCCFDGESAAVLRRYLEERPLEPERDLRMAIIRKSGHYMAADVILEIIGRLGALQAAR